MRKVKDFANNASILAIFLLKLCNFSQNFLLIMQFFAYWLCFSSFTENFPYFFAKYPHFGQNFWGSLKILKTTHKTGLRNDKDFSKKYTPMHDDSFGFRQTKQILFFTANVISSSWVFFRKLTQRTKLECLIPHFKILFCLGGDIVSVVIGSNTWECWTISSIFCNE